jgi:hypothetical protein
MMKFLSLITAILITPSISSALTAMTEEGEIVILRNDKTWEYERDIQKSSVETDGITETNKVIRKPNSATFPLKAGSTSFKVYFDPKKWKILEKDKDEEGRINLRSREGLDIYAAIIYESIELSLPTLMDAVLQNAKDFTPDITVNKKEYRKVNNTKSVYLEMQANHKGSQFMYRGVYTSDKSGSVQLLVYSTQKILDKNQGLVNDLLAGIQLDK